MKILRMPKLSAFSWCGVAGAAMLVLWLALSLIFSGPAWSLWFTFIIGAGLAGTWSYHERELLIGAAKSPALRSGSNALAFTAGIAGVIVLLNVITTRHSFRKDFTANNFFSLSSQTIKVVRGLNQKVKLTAFFKPGEDQQLRDLLEEYRHYSTNIEFEFIDPDKSPARAQIFKISSDNTTVVESGTRRKDIQQREIFRQSYTQQGPVFEFNGEEAITAAIISVTAERQQEIYFLEGHGERSPGDTGDYGMAEAQRRLEGENYIVKTLNLMKNGRIPEEAGLIIIAGLRRNISADESRIIRQWAANSGHLLVLLDPESPDGINTLLSNWGIKALNGITVDPLSSISKDPFTPIPAYGMHEITAELAKQRVPTLYPGSRALEALESRGFVAAPLLRTTTEAWLERNTTDSSPKYNPKTDLKGPLVLAMAVSARQKESAKGPGTPPEPQESLLPRIVVFGDSDFCSNRVANAYGNIDVFLNSANWLLGATGSISIRPKQADTRKIYMTTVQEKLLWLLCMFLTPLAVIGAGVWRWWRRRSL